MDSRTYDITDMLQEFGVAGDLEQMAMQGIGIYDAQGEIAAEEYFMPILGSNYGDARAIIRLLKVGDVPSHRFPATPDDVAGGF